MPTLVLVLVLVLPTLVLVLVLPSSVLVLVLVLPIVVLVLVLRLVVLLTSLDEKSTSQHKIECCNNTHQGTPGTGKQTSACASDLGDG